MTPLAAFPRIVLTYGRFDLFDQGHIRFLRDLSRMGTELIVGCTTDELASDQGRPCVTPHADRRALLESCRYVSRVINEADPDQKRTDIVNYNVSALVLGTEDQGRLDHLQDVTQVVYVARHVVQGRNPHLPSRMGLFATG